MTPPHEHETRQLIEHLRIKRLRRRWTRVLLLALGTAVIVGGLVTGAVLASSALNHQGSGAALPAVAAASTAGRTTMSKVPAGRSITTGPAVTRPATSGPPTTGAPASPARSSTMAGTTVTTAPPSTSTTNVLTNTVIVIDPGHQAHADPALEPVGPGSKQEKARVSSGTSSVLTGIPESEVTLEVGLRLQDALEALGARILMTRTSQDVDISNIERAEVGNKAGAALAIRLHANGSVDHSVHGLFTLYPASIKGWTDDIAEASKRAATIAQRDLIAATGAEDRGLEERSDLTGFNWSDVPVILVEMGFMTNPAEDAELRSPDYQDKIVQGLVRAVIDFLTATR